MVEIKFCDASQLPLINELAHEIWPVVYDYMISPQQIDYMLEKMYSLESLQQQFASGHVFILIQVNDDYQGFASFEVKENQTAKLHKLYLKKEMHGRGMGKDIIQFIEKYCVSKQQKEIELNVNRNNKSLKFYLSQGFNIHDTVDIEIGNGFEMNDYVLIKPLY